MSIRAALEQRGEALVARITLDNPRKLNCLTRTALAALAEQMREVELNARLRAVVITGAGEKAFVGGADAIRAQKRLCKLWEEAPLEASVRASVEEFARAYESGEPARRIEAFRRARKPRG